MKEKIDWSKAVRPLIKKYKGKKHPLDYQNVYQLIVMVVLSARDSDRHINQLAPAMFKKYPDFSKLAKANEEDLVLLIGKVTNWSKKIKWLLEIAKSVVMNKKMPVTMEELTALPGIGRKSANVIMREAGVEAEGVIVDLHVVRVAPRIGIAIGTDPKKIEEQIMNVIPSKDWGEIGMAISFLGREICRPKEPMHDQCVMKGVCAYYKKTIKN